MPEKSAANIAISAENPVHVDTQAGEFSVSDMAELLGRRYGDGIVYLPVGEEGSLYPIAVSHGYINLRSG